MSLLTREMIMSLIPHAGAMCLLDEIVQWDAQSIECLSYCFAAPGNPLRRADGTLGTACGIEIAAQSMAAHGRLTAPPSAGPVPGYLVALREVRLGVATLDNIEPPLRIAAARLQGDAGGASYGFSLSARNTELLRGRATVLFGALA